MSPLAMCNRAAVVLLVVATTALGEFSEYDARIDESEILTPAPAASPRINGPKVYGARPGKQFIYRIPTQGKRPMEFAVEDLPGSLELDPDQGILRGETPME